MKSSQKKLEYNRARYAANREAMLEQMREHYEQNKGRILARNAKYRATHGDNGARERSVRYEAKHRAARNEEKRLWRASNPGSAYAAKKRYFQRRPEVKKHLDQRYSARRRGAIGSHTREEWEAKKLEYGNRCAYCRNEAELQKDHDIPAAMGGADDISNIVPACRRCNSQKRALTGEQYRSQFWASR